MDNLSFKNQHLPTTLRHCQRATRAFSTLLSKCFFQFSCLGICSVLIFLLLVNMISFVFSAFTERVCLLHHSSTIVMCLRFFLLAKWLNYLRIQLCGSQDHWDIVSGYQRQCPSSTGKSAPSWGHPVSTTASISVILISTSLFLSISVTHLLTSCCCKCDGPSLNQFTSKSQQKDEKQIPRI